MLKGQATRGSALFTYESTSMRSVHAVILSLLMLSLSACALFPNRDPLNINVVGIEPLQSQDMEVRFAVKIRVQNPNDTTISYNGVALDLEVNGQPLASGVSDQSGSIARFSETVLTVPVSVSAFSVLRQTFGLSQTQTLNNMPYVLRGKLAGGLFGTRRFVDSGKLNLPGPTTGSR
jgi:LEA14-like dessication related protein